MLPASAREPVAYGGGMRATLSAAEARRLALAAQGLGRAASTGSATTRRLATIARRMEIVQLDSVAAFDRSHRLPFFARAGMYSRDDLDRMLFTPRGRFVECWGHEATVLPAESWPLLAHRRLAFAERHGAEGRWMHENRALLDWLLAEIARRGPVASREIEHEAHHGASGWWERSPVKNGLDMLFRSGELVSAGRDGFQRRYALPEQVLPRDILDVRIEPHDAIRELTLKALRAHGIGTVADIADYFRLPVARVGRALAELADAGLAVRVDVPEWWRDTRKQAVFADASASIPRSIRADALLSPFDPVVWFRPRTLRMFGMHYRIEIYTPAPKRQFGYYVLPVLQDDRLVARVDLKSDRAANELVVRAAWREPDATPDTAARLASLLRRASSWQGLASVRVEPAGTLAQELAGALAAAR